VSDEIRDHILDAAEQCIIEAGYSNRLHAAICERSGYSRPTVYKYVGDQDAIITALGRRELKRFFALAIPALATPKALTELIVDTVVLAVSHARGHRLLQAMLRNHPDVVLPLYTLNSGPAIGLAIAGFEPHIRAAVEAGLFPPVDARLLVEWTFRLAASLITTPGIVVTADADNDPVRLRAYVQGFVDLLVAGQGHP